MSRKQVKYMRIKQIKSRIGTNWKAKKTLDALGLKKIGKTVVHKNTPQIRGMVQKVKYLVEVEYVDSI